jgi:hypothetical protein
LKRFLAAILGFFVTAGQTAQAEGAGPQFSQVTSIELADLEVQKGNLLRVHLFPLELGGQDDPLNVTYIPIGMEDMWQKIIGTIGKFGAEGLIDKLSVAPEYSGASVVPCRIKFIGTHSTKKGGFEPTLELWKCA